MESTFGAILIISDVLGKVLEVVKFFHWYEFNPAVALRITESLKQISFAPVISIVGISFTAMSIDIL
ncbi:MAG: hypothetical protein U0L67_09230, partial [Paludibacteraceae bacterium]|nr:hypothetical protein [Paludibacteraceae bacterium]